MSPAEYESGIEVTREGVREGVILGKLRRDIGSLLIMDSSNDTVIQKRPFQIPYLP